MLQRKWTGVAIVFALAVLAASNGVAQESTSFSMDRITATAGGQSVSSTNYESTILAVQDSPSGAASFCNSGYVSSLGFFSVLRRSSRSDPVTTWKRTLLIRPLSN